MENILKQSTRDFSKINENIQTIIIALLAFLIPTFLGQLINTLFGTNSIVANNSQLIIGTIVNTLLIISALNLKGWNKIALIITMPSISTILSGFVFKSASVYMAWMIPAIWIGNLALILAFKYIMLAKGKSYLFATIIGVISKVVIIFGIFNILKIFNIFPEKLVLNLQNAMSLTQLITAIVGCLVAFGIYKVEHIRNK